MYVCSVLSVKRMWEMPETNTKICAQLALLPRSNPASTFCPILPLAVKPLFTLKLPKFASFAEQDFIYGGKPFVYPSVAYLR